MIAKKLDAKLRDFLTNSKASYADKMGATGRCAGCGNVFFFLLGAACREE